MLTEETRPARRPVGATVAGRPPARLRRVTASFSAQSLLVVAVVVAVAYWPVLLLGRVPLPMDVVYSFPLFRPIAPSTPLNANHAEMGDLVSGIYALHVFARHAVDAGSLGLWNQHLLAGQPFFGAYAGGMLSPLNWLYYLLPTHLAWALLFPIRLTLAGWFMALFVRSLGASRLGALVAGLGFAFCGFVLTWSGWPHVDAAIWLPLACLGVQKLWERPSLQRAGLAALPLAATMLAGHPQTEAYVLVMTAVFALWRLATPAPAGRARYPGFVGLLLLAGVLALLLDAVQLLPAKEWIGLTTRSGENRAGHLALQQLLGFVSRDTRHTPNSAGVTIPEAATYVGLLPLLLVPFALLWRRRGDVALFAGTAVTAGCVAYGFPPLFVLSTHLPVFGPLPTWRVIFLVQFALLVLAGLGVTALQDRCATRRPARGAAAALPWAVLAVGALPLALLAAHLAAVSGPARWFRGPLSTGLLLLAGVGLLAVALLRRLPAAAMGVAMVGLLAADLVSYGYGHVPFTPARDIYPTPPAFAALARQDPGLYRITAVSSTYIKNLELTYGLDTPSGVGYQIRTVDPLLSGLGAGLSGYVLDAKKIAAARRDRRLDLLNTKYLFATTVNGSDSVLAAQPERFRLALSSGTVRVFENLRVLPRAFVVPRGGVRSAPAPAAGYAAVAAPGFDPAGTVVVAGPPPTWPAARAGADRGAATAGGVRLGVGSVRYDGDDVYVGVATRSAGVLVLSDVVYPGWRVSVDGRDRRLLRVDGGLKGVAVGPGDRVVHFTFRPASVRAGATLSLLGGVVFVGCLGAPALLARRRRPARRPEPVTA